MTKLFIIFTIIMAATVFGCIEYTRYAQRNLCDGFSKQTGQNVKIIDYGYFLPMDCFIQTPDGKVVTGR